MKSGFAIDDPEYTGGLFYRQEENSLRRRAGGAQVCLVSNSHCVPINCPASTIQDKQHYKAILHTFISWCHGYNKLLGRYYFADCSIKLWMTYGLVVTPAHKLRKEYDNGVLSQKKKHLGMVKMDPFR